VFVVLFLQFLDSGQVNVILVVDDRVSILQGVVVFSRRLNEVLAFSVGLDRAIEAAVDDCAADMGGEWLV